MNQSSTPTAVSFICNSRFSGCMAWAALAVYFCLIPPSHANEAAKGCREAYADHANTIRACNVVIASTEIPVPHLIRALQIRAQALLSVGKPSDAVVDYTSAIVRLPTGQLQGYILYLRGRVRVQFLPDQSELGLLDLEQANAQAPANTRILEALAEVYLKNNQPEKTIRAASQAIEADPRSVVARRAKAHAHEKKGQLRLVLAELNTLLLQSPHDYDLFVWRGRIHQKRNNIYSALADYRKAVRIRTSDVLLERIKKLERALN